MSTVAPRVIGPDIAVEQAPIIGRDSQRGDFLTRTWVGSKATIYALKSKPPGLPSKMLASAQRGGWKLVAEYALDGSGSGGGPDANKPIVKWELNYEKITQAIESVDPYNTIGAKVIAIMKRAVENNQATDSDGTLRTLEEWLDYWEAGTTEGDYLRYRLYGVNNFEGFIYIVTCTTTYGSSHSVKAANTGVNKVTSVPLNGKVADLTNPLSMVRFSLPKGEYKRCPTIVRDAGRGHYDLVDRWEQAEKWDQYYGGTGKPGQ